MSSASTAVTRHARRFVMASPVFLVAYGIATLARLGPGVSVPLALNGFIFLMIFGKGYALIPSYFDTTLTPTWAPLVQFPVSLTGAVLLAGGGLSAAPSWVSAAGGILWGGGTLGFVATVGWTIRSNLTGRATGTSRVNEPRARLDRVANLGIPLVLAYLVVGSYLLIATAVTLPTGGVSRSGITHLFAAGGAALLVFAIGFRLFPRFLAATPPRGVPVVVLACGGIGPAVLAWAFYAGSWFRVGAILQAIAVIGFGVVFSVLFVRSDRDRIGLYGPLLGVGFGILGVGLGLQFAFGEVSGSLITVHRRLNLIGFLGLTIIGAAYQFYPPAVGTFPGASDRLAGISMVAIAGGLLLQLGTAVVSVAALDVGGELAVTGGTLLYAYLLLGLLYQRFG